MCMGMIPMLDLKPLERGMDALVRMADALERLASAAEDFLGNQRD